MSIVQKILGERADGRAIAFGETFHPVSRGACKLPGFLTESDAAHLRNRILSDGMDLTENASWASKRKELFNLGYIIELSASIQPLVECIYGEKVTFSYNFTSIYTHDVELRRHVDRAGCDVNFLIYLGDESICQSGLIIGVKDDNCDFFVKGKMGDAVIFLGRELEHFRSADSARKNLVTTILHYVFEHPFIYDDFRPVV